MKNTTPAAAASLAPRELPPDHGDSQGEAAAAGVVHPATVPCTECDGGWRVVGRVGAHDLVEPCSDCAGHGRLCAWCSGRVLTYAGDDECERCHSVAAERESAPSKAAFDAMVDAECWSLARAVAS